MVLLSDTKLVLQVMVQVNGLVLIVDILLVQWSSQASQQPFALYLVQLSLKPGIFINSISRMLSFNISMKQSTCINLWASEILIILPMYAYPTNHCMVSSKFLVHGIVVLLLACIRLASLIVLVLILCLFISLTCVLSNIFCDTSEVLFIMVCFYIRLQSYLQQHKLMPIEVVVLLHVDPPLTIVFFLVITYQHGPLKDN